MDVLRSEQIAAAGLMDWRKLAQGLHARYLSDGFTASAEFVAAVAHAGDELGHHPRVSIGDGFVDLESVSDDAIYREEDGTEHVIEWVTTKDVDLARRITAIATDHGLRPDPVSVSELELGLDTARSDAVAGVWSALLTGGPDGRGRGTPSDEVRDATGRVPNLWFGDANGAEPAAGGGAGPVSSLARRFHVEVYVAPEVVESRVAAVVAAGGTVVDESGAPALTVVADQDGNEGVICADVGAAPRA